jgi:ABC-2 type transport system permease protein
VAHKIAYILTSALPYGLVFWICRDYFRQLPDVPTFVAYVLSLFLGFLIGFFFETAMGMVGFWILEITSLLYVVGALNYFVSGHMFPLDLLGGWLATIFKALPFQYMAYFPAVLFLGKVPPDEIARALWLEAVWVVVFAGLTLALYRLGLRRYSAYGG